MKRALIAAGVCLFLVASARAAQLAGVSMPDSALVAGKTLKLNGQGLRTKLFFKIYVAGLYVENPTHDAMTIIAADEPKKIVMHFLYGKVTQRQLIEAWNEGFQANSPAEAGKLSSEISQLNAWMSDITSGQEISFTYDPAAGTTVEFAGLKKGTIPGPDFMKALFRVWLGDKPPTKDLKMGLLGVKS
jgi:hypothetical protein